VVAIAGSTTRRGTPRPDARARRINHGEVTALHAGLAMTPLVRIVLAEALAWLTRPVKESWKQ
jgi:hypothetical protein